VPKPPAIKKSSLPGDRNFGLVQDAERRDASTSGMAHLCPAPKGARQTSGPAVFYVVAVVLSFFLGAGAVALVALANPRPIDNDIVTAGTFLIAAFLTLVGAVEMMRRYVARRQVQGPRVQGPRGRRTRS
jgi:hypothetical protein